MNPPLTPLVLLPAATALLLAYALRPGVAAVAGGRLTVVRTAVVFGGYAVVSVEVLSAFGRLTTAGVALAWLFALLVAGVGVWWRRRRDRPDGTEPRIPRTSVRDCGTRFARSSRSRLSERWHALTRTERVLAVAVAGLLLAELVLALVSPPNTYDSQTYHLPRIEHWVAQQDVEFYPVRIHRQVTYAPGAEYVLTHLRLLTGGDALYGLLQWSAGVVALLAATRLTAQLGGDRRAQLLAAFVLASTPALVLEASSTQTDLVVAGWVACLATVVLDGVGSRAGPQEKLATVVLLGTATGLIAVTKQTGLFAAAPLLLWWGLARLRRGVAAGRPVPAAAGVTCAAVAVLAITAAITGPYVWRVYREFGNPLGPDYLRNSITMQRHDPPALLVNGLRQAQTLLDTPVPQLSRATAAGVKALSHGLGVDPSAPAITFDNTTFPTTAWYPAEDKAAYPIQALLMMVGAAACLVRPGLGGVREAVGRRRAYVSVVLVGLALHVSMLKWQPWGNRLFLYLVVLAAPLAGLMLAAAFGRAALPEPLPARHRRSLLVRSLAVILVVGGVAGALSVLYGWPRRLVGSQSVFVLDDWHARFVQRPAWADQYKATATVVRDSGARYIGIVQRNDTWEYPWWLLLPGRRLIAMHSMLPHHPPVVPRLDALVCAGSEEVCRLTAPPGWVVRMYGEVGWALPPGRVPKENPRLTGAGS